MPHIRDAARGNEVAQWDDAFFTSAFPRSAWERDQQC